MKKINYKLKMIVVKLYAIFGKQHHFMFRHKQLALFYESLGERYKIVDLNKISYNHKTSFCNYFEKQYSLKFPFRYLRNIKDISCEKKIKFSFIGIYNVDREWVKDFEGLDSQICFTTQGREINKFFFDKEYYTTLKSAYFVLCPRGDYNWSYRFFESIMCFAIPIIELNNFDETMEGFFYFTNDKPQVDYVYDIYKAKANYLLFLERHTFLSDMINISFLNNIYPLGAIANIRN